jgi:hypothetical protein
MSLLNAADRAMQRTLDGARTVTAAVTALWWPRRAADVRGHACHCPPGAPLHLVHSEGLREGAGIVVDYGSNVGSPHRRQVPVKALARIARQVKAGDIVHVKADLMGEFLTHVFPAIPAPIVLVTGDSDFSPVARYRHLLEEPRLAHWFAQNCDLPGRHPRLTRIPIGFDNPRYTKMEKRIGFLVEMALGKSRPGFSLSVNDIGNQKRLQEIARVRVAVGEKPLRALCTFHMNQKLVPDFSGVPDRRDAYDTLKPNPACYFVPHRLLQDECWRAHRDFAFEISPQGNGIDCFRTWEALFLDTIPIVKTSTLDPLYEDESLPVAVIPSWREVGEASLRRWRDGLQDRFTPAMTEKLTNDYWLGKIRDAAARARDWRGLRT